MSELIASRYILHDLLGQGGMGVVHRALDKLTGRDVALKQVTAATDKLQFNTSNSGIEHRVALAQEFRVLASLRHPHIISVLDYGFDAERQPFFTMDLLENARTIVDYARSASYSRRIDLVQQMLQALRYLHRRGILHRDLKPDNVMVVDGVVRVLDFGLALRQPEAENKTMGTLAYLSPEALQHGVFSWASDIYAVGLIVYEIFAGEHPYDTSSINALFSDILSLEVGTEHLDLSEDLQQLLQAMVEKDPEQRPPDVDTILQRFIAATGKTRDAAGDDFRDSYIQAAQFVGRDRELSLLTDALKRSVKGQGNAWLIGGESGSGKTRLLEELRIDAMVNGALVLEGEGVAGGGLRYHLWRNSLRLLALVTDLKDMEASVLKDIIPDIGTVLGREVPDAPALDGRAYKQRFIQVILAIFRRQTQPILLLLEDLHWLSESLDVIPALCELAQTQSLMIVGTYRTEERPDLLHDLPEMRPIQLRRLTEDEIAELSSAMLGEVGKHAEIVDLLQRETGGNVFFLVETVRALAEHAGDLDNIGLATLPATVFSGGIEQIIRQRLHQISAEDYTLLKIAAVIGRVVDPELIRSILRLSDRELVDWFIRMGNAAILDVQGEIWRFAHDKLRQAVLADLELDEKRELHRQVAEAIERQYGEEGYVEVILRHWQETGDENRERHYAFIAGVQARNQSAFEDAKRYLHRVLALMPDQGEESIAMLAHNLLGDVYEMTGNYPVAIGHFSQGLAHARRQQNDRAISDALRGLGKTHWRLGDYGQGRIHLEAALAHQPDGLTYISLGDLAWSEGDFDAATAAYYEALGLTELSGNILARSQALQGLGVVASRNERYNEARVFIEQSIALKDEIGYHSGIAGGLNSLGVVAYRQQDYLASRNFFQRGIALASEIGNTWVEMNAACNLAYTCLATERMDDALEALNRSLRRALMNNAVPILLELVVGYAHVLYLQKAYSRAAELMGLVATHPSVNDFTLSIRLQPLRDLLQPAMPEADFVAAWERGSALDLETTLQEISARLTGASTG